MINIIQYGVIHKPLIKHQGVMMPVELTEKVVVPRA